MNFMSLLGYSARIAAKFYDRKVRTWKNNAVSLQDKVLRKLIKKGSNTVFGRNHSFERIKTYGQFRSSVPVSDYEALRSWFDRVRLGEQSILWPGRPAYFAVTSGTTSGAKYIPVTKDSIPNHIDSARTALLNYIDYTGKTGFLDGKYIFLSGSPMLGTENGIPAGRLSGIVNHHVPDYLRKNQLPDWEANCLEDWGVKLDAIVEQTINENISLISGIPPWVEMYFERLLERSEKPFISGLFPGFSLFVYGGVNFKPYERKFSKLIGGEVDSMETFPASEGFFAFQDQFPGNGLLLIPDSGIFYEFIPLDKFHEADTERVPLAGVQTGVNYVMIISSNAGLWGYNIGDTVRFISTDPYRLTVTGRVSQFISAFGEHVIAREVESAIAGACKMTGAEITEFTVAPLVDNPAGKPCHEWFIEFSQPPPSLEAFGRELDLLMRKKNHYYDDLVKGKIIRPLVIRVMSGGSFAAYMNSKGKLGGQNKLPHLRNDREMADSLITYL